MFCSWHDAVAWLKAAKILQVAIQDRLPLILQKQNLVPVFQGTSHSKDTSSLNLCTWKLKKLDWLNSKLTRFTAHFDSYWNASLHQ